MRERWAGREVELDKTFATIHLRVWHYVLRCSDDLHEGELGARRVIMGRSGFRGKRSGGKKVYEAFASLHLQDMTLSQGSYDVQEEKVLVTEE